MSTERPGPTPRSSSRSPSAARVGEGAEVSLPLLLTMAGLGGTLPTLSRTAAFYVANPGADLPAAGFYVGLFCFFLIGAIIGFALAERNARRAVLVGIAAPAVITNVAQGVSEGQESQPVHPPALASHAPSTEYASGSRISLLGAPHSPLYIVTQEFSEEIVIEAEMPAVARGVLDANVVFIFEALTLGEWNEKPVADVAIGNAIKFLPSPGTKALGFVAGEATAAVDLEPGFTGRICLELGVSSRSDFLWALGFRRSTTITSIEPILTDQGSCASLSAHEQPAFAHPRATATAAGGLA